jgi:hypothetical protein
MANVACAQKALILADWRSQPYSSDLHPALGAMVKRNARRKRPFVGRVMNSAGDAAITRRSASERPCSIPAVESSVPPAGDAARMSSG